ncbi:MAG TPA: ATP-binding protein, partial [Candidatus Gracilibacteria bacterium]|nr:ATP-binding protein [Candidatus Gracilibacteria bacterium]
FYQREIQENNIQVKIEYDKQLSHYLYGGGVYLQQILENLFKNAIRYGRPQDPSIIPEIKISVQKIQDIPLQVQIKVQDNGSGIKDKDKNQLFSFRHRSEDSKNYQGKEGSNGLGLAFARKVIEVLGGEINYISPKVGTCFYFNIPLQYSEKNLEKSNPILPLQNLNLVMVDDDKINHQLFSINLADRNQIQSFYQSENTLNHLIDRFYQKEEEIDAIILDKNIGEEDGLELARNIRMIGKTIQNFKCPALILYTGSSKNESPEIQTALEQEVIQEAIDKTANIAELSYAIYRQLSPIKQSQQYSQFSPEIQKYIQENPTLKTKEQNTPEAPPIKKLSIDPDLNHFDAHIINRSFSNQLYIIQNVYPIIHNLFNQNREYFAKLKEAILGKNLSQLSRVCHTFSPLLNNFGASALKHNIEQIRYFYEGKEQLSPVEWEEISKFCQNYNADYIQQFLQEFSKYISQIILERLNKINFIKDENEKDLKINSVVQFCAYNQLNITEALNNIGISGIDSFNISSYEQIKLLIKEIPKIDTDLLEKKLTEIFFSNLNN